MGGGIAAPPGKAGTAGLGTLLLAFPVGTESDDPVGSEERVRSEIRVIGDQRLAIFPSTSEVGYPQPVEPTRDPTADNLRKQGEYNL